TVDYFSSRRRHTRSKRDWSSDVCSSDLEAAEPTVDHEEHTSWWGDPAVLVPVTSGVALLVGLILEWFVPGTGLAAAILFWISLVLGASQFVPGALRGLFTSGRLGIGVLMTISATGAVLL